jgi:hypothetical protein
VGRRKYAVEVWGGWVCLRLLWLVSLGYLGFLSGCKGNGKKGCRVGKRDSSVTCSYGRAVFMTGEALPANGQAPLRGRTGRLRH